MTDAVDLLLRSLPILLGGGAVQLIIFLFKLPGEMRTADKAAAKVDAESGSVVVSSAERSLALSDQVRDDAVTRAVALAEDLGVQNERVKRLMRRLALAETEVEELRGEVGALSREVERLRVKHPGP